MGWESFGGEFMPAAAEVVCRFWERHRPRHSLILGRRVGPQVALDCLDPHIRRRETIRETLRGEAPGGRAREWRGTRTYGRVGTRRVGDTMESRRHGGGGDGPLASQGYIRTHNRRVEGCQGGVAGGVPPHKGGPELQGAGVRGQELRGEAPGGRAREWRGTRTHGRVGTRRVGDTMESRRHGGGGDGPLASQGYIRTHNRRVEGCQGGVAGGVPPHKGGPSGPTVQRDAGKRIAPLCREWSVDRP